MNKEQYLQQTDIQEFIKWVNTKTETNSFTHKYTSLKPKRDWYCNSIYDAYENYNWSFSFTDSQGNKRECNTFEQSTNYLNNCGIILRKAIADNDNILTRKKCDAILAWGGVSRNRNISVDMLKSIQKLLDPQTFDTEKPTNGIPMNSGYSKIYSCIIDDFIIYDSRVGAALGLLVRKFCEETGTKFIPENLHFAFADARPAKGHTGKIRDPGNEVYKFSKLNNNPSFYIHNNMRANWLAKAVTDHSDNKFSKLEKDKRMRAFESALFMIGYKVNQGTTAV